MRGELPRSFPKELKLNVQCARVAGVVNITKDLPLVTAKATYRLADSEWPCLGIRKRSLRREQGLDMPLLRSTAESQILADLSPESVWHELASDFACQYNFIQPPLIKLAKDHWVGLFQFLQSCFALLSNH